MARLRAVTDADVPPPVLTLDEAIASGDPLKIMLAQRREIAHDLPSMQGPAKAAMHRQLTILTKEIAVLEAKEPDADDGAETPDEEWDQEAL